MSARHFPSRSPVLPSGFPPRIHASGIPGRDSCFRNSDPGFAFRIHGSGFWPGPRILAGPPVHSRFSAGFPQFFRDLRCFPAVFQRLRSLPTVFPRPHPAVSSAVSPAVPRQSSQQSPGGTRRHPRQSQVPPAVPPAVPGGPTAVPRRHQAAPRQFQVPPAVPPTVPSALFPAAPGYLMSWRLTFLSEKEKVLPTPNSLRTVIRSPCASMMCLTMARPSPVPPCSRERPLSVR